MEILGCPGAYADQLVRTAQVKRVGAYLACAASTLGVVAAGCSAHLTWWMFALAAGVWLWTVAIVPDLRRREASAAIGAAKEREVACLLLDRLEGVAVFGLQLGRSRGSREDVDCLVCPASGGFYVLEIKTGFGRISVHDSGAVQAGKRVLPGDPVAQARRARADVDRLLRSASCAAMVVISDASGAPVWRDGVLVCAPHVAVARMRGSGGPTDDEVAALGRVRSVARRQRKRVTGC